MWWRRRLWIPVYYVQTLDATGAPVTAFQVWFNRTNHLGLEVPQNGTYGRETVLTVQAYQLQKFKVLNSDGFIGPQTAKALHIVLVES